MAAIRICDLCETEIENHVYRMRLKPGIQYLEVACGILTGKWTRNIEICPTCWGDLTEKIKRRKNW